MLTPQFVQRTPPNGSDGPPTETEPPQQIHRRNKSTDTATSSIGMNFNDNQSILTNQSWLYGGGASALIHTDTQTVTSNATNLFLQFDSHLQKYFCPHHRYSAGDEQQPIYYKYATDICPHCEQDFKNHTAYLQQRQKDVMERLNMYDETSSPSHPHADTTENNNGMPNNEAVSAAAAAAAPPIRAMVPNAVSAAPPVYPPVYAAAPPPQPQYAQPPPVYPPPGAYHPYAPQPQPMYATAPPPMHAVTSFPPQQQTEDVARMRHIQDYIFMEKSKECDDMKQRLQQQTELIQQLKIENALLNEKLIQQEMRMQQELKFLKLHAARKTKAPPPQRSLVLVNGSRKNRLDQYSNHPNQLRPYPPPPPSSHDYDDNGPHNNVVSPLSSPVPYASQGEESYAAEPPPPPWKLAETGNGPRGPRPMMDYFDDDIQDDYHKDEEEEEEEEDEEEDASKNPKNIPPATAPLTTDAALKNPSTIPQHFEVDDHAPPVVPLEETISVATFVPTPPTIQRSNDWTEVVASDGWDAARETNGIPPPAASAAATTKSIPSTTTTAAKSIPPPTTTSTTTKRLPPPAKLPPPPTAKPPTPVARPPPPTEPNVSHDVEEEEEMETWSYVAAVEDHGGKPSETPPRAPVGVGVNAANSAPPPSKGVTWTDDAGSAQSVASSTFGEDRHHVTDQEILDPYGDRGTYSGIILRSTGMPHGSGVMMYQEDHRTYDGEWRHGRWHGHGKATFANGDSYLGEYRFDQRHGRGRYEWNDGRVYDGMFREDKRHGRGNFIWPDGAAYEGEFRNGQREGQGTYRFSDGGKYEGSWRDGRYSGFGICSWEDGRCYKGEWMNGMAHGRGVETFPDGTVRHDGMWIEDEPVATASLL